MNKKNYIALITRETFNSILKYGIYNIDRQTAIRFYCKEDELNQHLEICDKLFRNSNPFDISMEYVMITYSKEAPDPSYRIRITDLNSVYSLDDDSLDPLRNRLDSRILVKIPIWPQKVEQIEKNNFFLARKRGIDNVWSAFGLSPEAKEKCSEIVTDDVIKEFVNEVFLATRPSGDLSIWVYLLRYERHDAYPKDNIGFMMDTIHVYINYDRKDENQGASLTGSRSIVKALLKYKGNKEYSSIIKFVEETQSNFVATTNQKAHEGYYRIAPLFLRFQAMFFDRGLDINIPVKRNQKFRDAIDRFKKQCKMDFYIASYLLGIFLGYDKTYDTVYELENLSIFKKKGEPQRSLCDIKKPVEPIKTKETISAEQNSKYSKENKRRISSKMNKPEELTLFSDTVQPQTPTITKSHETKPKKKPTLTCKIPLTLDVLNQYKIKYPIYIQNEKKEKEHRSFDNREELASFLKNGNGSHKYFKRRKDKNDK